MALLDSDRLYDWKGQCGVIGGIPNRTTIGTNVKDFGAVGDGVTDDTSAFAAAIAACPDNQVVYMPDGTFRLNSRLQVNRGRFTLRGAGIGKTVLKIHAPNEWYFGNGTWPVPTPSLDVVAGATKGSTTLTVGSTVGVNTLVLLTEENRSTVKYNTNYYGNGPSNSGHDKTRLRAFPALVTSKTATEIELHSHLPIDMDNNPKLSVYTSRIDSFGFEDFTFDVVNANTNAVVFITQATNLWFRRVRFQNMPKKILTFDFCLYGEISQCEFFDTQKLGSNTEGVDLIQNCAFFKIENNIHSRGGFPMVIMGDWGGGVCCNAVLYNLFLDAQSGGSVAAWAMSDNHGPHNSFNLFEGNHGQNFSADAYYGSSSEGTLFRNRLSGVFDLSFSGAFAINLGRWSINYNIAGNILGDPGFPVDQIELTGKTYKKIIYRFGYPAPGHNSYVNESSNPASPDDRDTNVKATALIRLNYNYTDNAIPSGEASEEELPASLFYDSKPEYFGPLAWPPFDPTNPNPEMTAIPAGYRYVNGSDPGHVSVSAYSPRRSGFGFGLN